MLLDRFSVSERRACRAIGQPRSTQRRPAPVPGTEEENLRSRLRQLARAHPRYGYRRMTTILRREGYCVNHKRIQRLCRDEGLRVLKKAKKRSRVGTSVTDGTRLRATHPGHVWAIDFQFDQTTNFKTLKLLNITDGQSRFPHGSCRPDAGTTRHLPVANLPGKARVRAIDCGSPCLSRSMRGSLRS